MLAPSNNANHLVWRFAKNETLQESSLGRALTRQPGLITPFECENLCMANDLKQIAAALFYLVMEELLLKKAHKVQKKPIATWGLSADFCILEYPSVGATSYTPRAGLLKCSCVLREDPGGCPFQFSCLEQLISFILSRAARRS